MTHSERGATRSPLTGVPEVTESLDRLVRLALVGGTAVACAVFAAVDLEVSVRVVRGDGLRAAAGDVVPEASGREGVF